MKVPEGGVAGLRLRRHQCIPAFDNLEEESASDEQLAVGSR
jgi:hypothetical protein